MNNYADDGWNGKLICLQDSPAAANAPRDWRCPGCRVASPNVPNAQPMSSTQYAFAALCYRQPIRLDQSQARTRHRLAYGAAERHGLPVVFHQGTCPCWGWPADARLDARLCRVTGCPSPYLPLCHDRNRARPDRYHHPGSRRHLHLHTATWAPPPLHLRGLDGPRHRWCHPHRHRVNPIWSTQGSLSLRCGATGHCRAAGQLGGGLPGPAEDGGRVREV